MFCKKRKDRAPCAKEGMSARPDIGPGAGLATIAAAIS